jgi:hypothetical protein
MYSWDDMSGAVEEIDIKHDSALDTPKFRRDKRARPLATCPILPCSAAAMSAKDFYLAKKKMIPFAQNAANTIPATSQSENSPPPPLPQDSVCLLVLRLRENH